MNQFLRSLSATQQVGLLFVLVFGALTACSAVVFAMSLRNERRLGDLDLAARDLVYFRSLLKSTWLIVGVFWLGWSLGRTATIVLFAVVAFFAMREFTTLSPTRRGDHRSLVLAFFVILPVQFWLVAKGYTGLFSVFVPVYVFAALPVVSALAGDPVRFLERNAKLQWGIMVCVYGLSHVPALLLLEFRGWDLTRNAFLLFFLVMTAQIGLVAQYLTTRQLLSKRLLAAPAPGISQSFSWRGWAAGVLVAAILGALFAGITPFKPGQAFAMAGIACATASLGRLVMKALERDRGATAWGKGVRSVTGGTGVLSRVDGLCFAAPVFYHSVRWYFNI